MERDGAAVRKTADLPVVMYVPQVSVAPFARFRHSALSGESAPYFDPAVLGFEPRDLEGIEDDRMKWVTVNGLAQPLSDCEDRVSLAADLERIGRTLFKDTHCRVVITTVRAACLERHIDNVLNRCNAERYERAMRPGFHSEWTVLSMNAIGQYAARPFLLAAQIIVALHDCFENVTLTGEETVDGALDGCEASVSVLSDPAGFLVARHPSMLALGVEYCF